MKKFEWILLFWIVILLAWVEPGRAADNPLPNTLKVGQNTATPRFPENIQFEFQAKNNDNNLRFKKAELHYQLVGEVETSVRSAKLENRPNGEFTASLQIDTQKDYIPPGTRLRYYWLFYNEAGATYSSASQQLIYQDSRFSFRELKSGVVTLRWYQGNDNFGQMALNKATATIEKLGKLYNLTPKDPINITIYPDSRTMFTALPPNTAEWVGGQAIPSLGTIVLAIAPNNLAEIGRSIPHEVSHQVVYQATLNPYNTPPRWLDEGLAVNNQDQVEPLLEEAFARGVDKGNLYPLRVLNGSFPADSAQSYLAYAQSLKVVQYIQKEYGQQGLAKILAAFKDGVSYDEAVRRGIGRGLDDLDREWKLAIGYPVTPPEAVAATPTTAVTSGPTVSVTAAPTPTSAIASPTPLPTATPAVSITSAGSGSSLLWLLPGAILVLLAGVTAGLVLVSKQRGKN